MNVPDVYEFAVTPSATYVLAENGPGIARIYTDGRQHPPAEELWGTYTGASVGHWEGDTLVFETRGLKESRDNDVIIDRTGLVLSDAARVTTRLRRVNDMMLEAVMVIEDAKALKAPWKVTKQYRKLPGGGPAECRAEWRRRSAPTPGSASRRRRRDLETPSADRNDPGKSNRDSGAPSGRVHPPPAPSASR